MGRGDPKRERHIASPCLSRFGTTLACLARRRTLAARGGTNEARVQKFAASFASLAYKCRMCPFIAMRTIPLNAAVAPGRTHAARFRFTRRTRAGGRPGRWRGPRTPAKAAGRGGAVPLAGPGGRASSPSIPNPYPVSPVSPDRAGGVPGQCRSVAGRGARRRYPMRGMTRAA